MELPIMLPLTLEACSWMDAKRAGSIIYALQLHSFNDENFKQPTQPPPTDMFDWDTASPCLNFLSNTTACPWFLYACTVAPMSTASLMKLAPSVSASQVGHCVIMIHRFLGPIGQGR
eukprot:1159808-Pelagomonas_calceolata.AAC.4